MRVYIEDERGHLVRRTWKCTGWAVRAYAEAIVHRWQLEEILPTVSPERHAAAHVGLAMAAAEWALCASMGRANNYRRIIRSHVKRWVEVWGDRACSEIQSHDVVEYINGRLSAGCVASTVNLELAVLRRFYRWALDQGYASSQPIRRDMHIRCPLQAVRTIAPAEELRLLAIARTSERLYGHVLCLLETGFRSGVLDRLRWEHVDLEAGEWRVPAELMKSRREYRQPIAEKLLAWLRAHARPSGKIWSHNFAAKWRRLRDAAGLPGLRRHDLRRTFVTRCRQAGVPLEVTMALSDHHNVAVMLRLYRAVDEAEARQALRAVFGGDACGGRQPGVC